MAADQLVLVLWVALATGVLLLPLRWSLLSYVLLSTVDFRETGNDVSALNVLKAIILPLYLLWRLRRYSGHGKVLLAPIAWILLAVYAGVAGFWSFYPVLSLKLVGHMLALVVICCVFLRASKGSELRPAIVLPGTVGIIAIAALRSVFAPHYGDEAARFTTFSTAQSFAALVVAFYCIALCSKSLLPAVRICLCCVLPIVLVFDGSRIWAVGLILSTLLALFIADIRTWIKLCTLGLLLVITATAIGSTRTIMTVLSDYAPSNRIVAAISAAYEGDTYSTGLGTLRFRKGLTSEVVDQLEKSSTVQLLIGHGTCNGPLMGGSVTRGLDPNRFFHDEWLRVIYEWGAIGLILFVLFVGSLVSFAFTGFRKDKVANAKPLLVYLPAFLLGLTGENIMAGAGNAVSIGLLLVIGLAGISHRPRRRGWTSEQTAPAAASELDGRIRGERLAAPFA